jgi:origin recognition complex subunit 1
MPGQLSTNITPRRSTRHQPQVRPVRTSQPGDWTHRWSGDPLLVRPTQPGDLHAGEPFKAEDEESEEENGGLLMVTAFYGAFCRARDAKRTTKTKLGKGKENGAESEIFSVGDTVLIHSTNKKTPNVGVITALWDTRITQGEPTDGVKFESMKVKIHWFIRPEQTARVSARRHHLPVRSCRGLHAN